MIWIIGGIVLALFGIGIVAALFSWYRIVPKGEAHVVVSPQKTFVVSGNPKFRKDWAKATYFHFPEFIPGIGRNVRIMSLLTQELKQPQETIEKGQARYNIETSVKYRVIDVDTAAETIINDTELRKQLDDIIKAGVREITVKYNVIDARAKKKEMEDEIRESITDDFGKWGLELVNFQLVDFQDTKDSKIISDISRIREKELEANRREMNAEKDKQAREKEAAADEAAQTREIKRDEIVGMKKQNKEQQIAEQQKLAKEKELEVTRVEQVVAAEIEKDKKIVEAEQQRETEKIFKEQKKLEGEGDRDRDIEQAKGKAAETREMLLAEAEGKDKLQEALNKFGDPAIRAMVANDIVTMQEKVGVAGAQALEKADVKAFLGGSESDKNSYDVGKALSALTVGNEDGVQAVLNRIKRPNDLGIGAAELSKLLGKPEPKEPVDSKKDKVLKKVVDRQNAMFEVLKKKRVIPKNK